MSERSIYEGKNAKLSWNPEKSKRPERPFTFKYGKLYNDLVARILLQIWVGSQC